MSPSTREPYSKVPNHKITTQPFSPHTETESSNSKMTSDSSNETIDSYALIIDENEANITKNLHNDHTGDSHEESTDNSSDIGDSNEEDEPLQLNETSNESGRSDEPDTNRHLSDKPDQTRRVVLLTTAQVIDLQRIQDKHTDKLTGKPSKDQKIKAKGNMARALFNIC